MHPFSTPKNIGKRYGFLMFSWDRERVHWERMNYSFFTVLSKNNNALTFSCIMLQNGQTYFKKPAVLTLQEF